MGSSRHAANAASIKEEDIIIKFIKKIVFVTVVVIGGVYLKEHLMTEAMGDVLDQARVDK